MTGQVVPFPDAEKTAGQQEAERWEDLVLLGSRRLLPVFPMEAFPKWLADMVRGVAEETQTPLDIPAGMALGALSTACGGKAVVKVRGYWEEPTNLFLAMVAEPGTRKSAVFRALTSAVYAAEKSLTAASKEKRRMAEILRVQLEEADRQATAKAKSGDASDLVNAVEAAKELEEAQVPAETQLIAKNVTPEECSTLLAEQGGRLSILSAEGDVFDIICGRYSNGVPALTPFLEGHAGDVLKVNRRGRAEYVEAPALTIAVCIQPTVLSFIASKPRLRGQGLLARFLYALPVDLVGHRKSQPDTVPEDVRTTYESNVKSMVLSLADWAPAVTLDLTDPAYKLVVEFMDEIEPKLRANGGEFENLRDWANKLVGAAVRIAGLLHIAAHLKTGYQNPVSDTTMRNAIAVARYYAAHAMAAFGAMDESEDLGLARLTIEWITKGEHETFTKRDLHRGLQHKLKSAEKVTKAIALLEVHGYIRTQPAPERSAKGGRAPSPVYAVHPDLFKTTDTTDRTN